MKMDINKWIYEVSDKEYFIYRLRKIFSSYDNLSISYGESHRDVHVYYKDYVILHISIQKKLYIHNRFTNRANDHLSKLKIIKLKQCYSYFYEQLPTKQERDIVSHFNSKHLTERNDILLINYINDIIENIDVHISKYDDVFSDLAEAEEISNLTIYISKDFTLSELGITLKCIDKMHSLISNYIEGYFDASNRNHSSLLVLERIKFSSSGLISLTGVSGVLNIIAAILNIQGELTKHNIELEIKRVELEELESEARINKIRRLSLLSKMLDDCTNEAAHYIMIELDRLRIELAKLYGHKPLDVKI